MKIRVILSSIALGCCVLIISACGPSSTIESTALIEAAEEEEEIVEDAAEVEEVETVVEEPTPEGIPSFHSGEYVLLENLSEIEIEVEITVETDTSEETSSISLQNEDGSQIENVSGDVAFGTIWKISPGNRITLNCAEDVNCNYDIDLLSKNEIFIERTKMSCGTETTIYEHNLDYDMHLFFILEDECEGDGDEKNEKCGFHGTTEFTNTWAVNEENIESKEKRVWDSCKVTYSKTAKKDQNDSFYFECCGNKGNCYYEVYQLPKE